MLSLATNARSLQIVLKQGVAVAPNLVFIHGIGGPRHEDAELTAWTDALAKGAAAAGHADFVDRDLHRLDRKFVYYGDLFAKPGAQGESEADESSDIDEDEDVERLLAAMIENLLAEEHPAETRRQLERAARQLNPDGTPQVAGRVAGRVINAATTLVDIPFVRRGSQWMTAKLLVWHFRQVSRYLSRKPTKKNGTTLKEQIQHRLRAAIHEENTVLVAHSLGTVVAYETLHTLSASVPLLVTIGSPLALRTVVLPKVLPSPLRTPEAVGRWLDFWDREDFIAARPLVRHDVEPNSDGIVPISAPTLSDGLWAHSAVKYLKQAQIAGPIAEALRS